MKNKIFIVGAGFVVLILSIGARFTWENYFSQQAKQNEVFEQNLEKYTSGMEAFEAAMRADTWGGKTPEETLTMFVDALKRGDIDLASKYFMLDTNTQSPDYLTRNKWGIWLLDLKEKSSIETMVTDIEVRAKPDLSQNLYEGDYKFILKTDNDIVGAVINMELNKYSQVWKIESI
jgi:hypothetical protein